MNENENYHKRMIVYVYFSSIGEEEIDDFSYTKIDLNKQREIDVEIRMIQHVLECVQCSQNWAKIQHLIDVLIEFDLIHGKVC